EDPETGELGYVDTGRRIVRDSYAKELSRRDAARDKLFGRLGLDQVQLRIGDDYVKPLVAFFRRRGRRLGALGRPSSRWPWLSELRELRDHRIQSRPPRMSRARFPR